MRITEQEKLNENAGTAFLTGMFFSMIFAQIGLRLADQGVGLLDSDQYLNLFHPILVRRCKAIAKEHAEELEGLSAQSATKYLGKIIKEEDPGLWDKLGALRGGYNDGWNIRQIAVGKRSGPSNKEKLAQIKARYGESTERIFDRVLKEYSILDPDNDNEVLTYQNSLTPEQKTFKDDTWRTANQIFKAFSKTSDYGSWGSKGHNKVMKFAKSVVDDYIPESRKGDERFKDEVLWQVGEVFGFEDFER